MEMAADHLLKIKKTDLVRKSIIAGFLKQQLVQQPTHNNYIFTSLLNQVLTGEIPISTRMDPSLVSLNFNEVEDEEKNLDYSHWFSTPEILSFGQLSNTNQQNLRNLLPLFPLFKQFLGDDLDPAVGKYNNIFYGVQEERLFFQYPAYSSDLLKDWQLTDEYCKYFDPPKMEFYDARWRPFYQRAVDQRYDAVWYGPYDNPSSNNQFYALTLSQAINLNNEVHGVLNHDINLNFEGEYDTLFRVSKPDPNSSVITTDRVPGTNLLKEESHYFITGLDGTLVKHSKVTIEGVEDTLTKAEFSQTNTSLDHELYNNETEHFNNTFLPLFRELNSTTIVEYSKYGVEYMAALNPMIAKLYPIPGGDTRIEKIFIYTQVTDKQIFISSITDKSEFYQILAIGGGVFMFIVIILMVISTWIFRKIPAICLKSIKNLNQKVSSVINSNRDSELTLSKVRMTSYEAFKVYEIFTEIFTTKKFTLNTMMNNTDAVSIMEYAEAYTVFKGNNKVQGICLTNIGHTYYKLKDYEKASKSYEEAAKCASCLIKGKEDKENMSEYVKLYCKRKYYSCIWKFLHLKKKHGKFNEEEILVVTKQIEKTKNLIKKYFGNSADDILIMLNLLSSKCLLMTRRLISAERDLNIAIWIFKNKTALNQEDRPDIPIIPSCILRQRIILQQALVFIDFKKIKKAATILTKLLKVGIVYDPAIRKEALETLQKIVTNWPQNGNLMEKFDELKNIEKNIQLFNSQRNKNVILLVDPTAGEHFTTKTNLCWEIFDNLGSKDYVSMISIHKKVKRVFSMTKKTQNTVQLYNQLKVLEPWESPKIPLMKGIYYAIEDMKAQASSEDKKNNFKWIVLILSTPDTSSFQPKICRKIEKSMKDMSINLLLISVGNNWSKEFLNLYKMTDFNESTIFLNVSKNFSNKDRAKERGRSSTFMNGKRRPKSTNPDILQIQSLMANISNIQMIEENLIYEKF